MIRQTKQPNPDLRSIQNRTQPPWVPLCSIPVTKLLSFDRPKTNRCSSGNSYRDFRYRYPIADVATTVSTGCRVRRLIVSSTALQQRRRQVSQRAASLQTFLKCPQGQMPTEKLGALLRQFGRPSIPPLMAPLCLPPFVSENRFALLILPTAFDMARPQFRPKTHLSARPAASKSISVRLTALSLFVPFSVVPQ